MGLGSKVACKYFGSDFWNRLNFALIPKLMQENELLRT